MDNISIPFWMIEKIRSGEAILFLGAGATKGAKGENGEVALSGHELRDALCNKFLNGDEKKKSLARVADYCLTESSLFEVQNFIRELFEPLNPDNFHLIIPTFKWHSIVIVNYDIVVEKSYDLCRTKKQNLKRIISDGDDYFKSPTDSNTVPFLKLHGCVKNIHDEKLPLILSSEQYSKYKNNRIKLFGHFKEWARQHPIIFCGYDISDPNIHEILFQLTDEGIKRPAYLAINKYFSQYDERYWQAKRINPVKAKFKNFIEHLDNEIPEFERSLSVYYDPDKLELSKSIKGIITPSSDTYQYLQNELEHVYKGMPYQSVNPRDFYSGLNNSWGIFHQDLDIERGVSEEILFDAILSNQDTEGLKVSGSLKSSSRHKVLGYGVHIPGNVFPSDL